MIAPETFVNFDKRSTWYIFDTYKLPRELIKAQLKPNGKLTGEQYLELIDMVKAILNSGETSINNFIDLSYEAWRYSEEVNKAKRNGNESLLMKLRMMNIKMNLKILIKKRIKYHTESKNF